MNLKKYIQSKINSIKQKKYKYDDLINEQINNIEKSKNNYQLGNFEIAEAELRKLIRRYPTFADARAALTALQWSRGKFGEAESNWIAASELDARYFQKEWLLNVRRWPPNPTRDLMKFIDLQ